MKRFVFFLVILSCIVLTGCETIEREEKIDVTATVTNLQYRDWYVICTPMYIGKTLTSIPQTYPSKHVVTISYDDVSEEFDDKKLYEKVKVGDSIKMVLNNCYDKDNDLIIQTLHFPK